MVSELCFTITMNLRYIVNNAFFCVVVVYIHQLLTCFTAYVDACFVDLCFRLSSAVIKHNIQLVPNILIFQKKCSWNKLLSFYRNIYSNGSVIITFKMLFLNLDLQWIFPTPGNYYFWEYILCTFLLPQICLGRFFVANLRVVFFLTVT